MDYKSTGNNDQYVVKLNTCYEILFSDNSGEFFSVRQR